MAPKSSFYIAAFFIHIVLTLNPKFNSTNRTSERFQYLCKALWASVPLETHLKNEDRLHDEGVSWCPRRLVAAARRPRPDTTQLHTCILTGPTQLTHLRGTHKYSPRNWTYFRFFFFFAICGSVWSLMLIQIWCTTETIVDLYNH